MISNTQILALVLGVAVTWVTSFLKNPKWSDRDKVGLALGLSILAAVLQLLFTGQLHGFHGSHWLPALLSDVGIVFTASTAYFKGHFSGTSAEAWLARLLHAVDPAVVDPPSATPAA